MKRRTFLAKATATVGLGALAGCSGGDTSDVRVESRSGFEESDVFRKFEHDREDGYFHLFVTESATVEAGVKKVVLAVSCGTTRSDYGPTTYEYELDPKQVQITDIEYCAGQYTFTAYDNLDSPVSTVEVRFVNDE